MKHEALKNTTSRLVDAVRALDARIEIVNRRADLLADEANAADQNGDEDADRVLDLSNKAHSILDHLKSRRDALAIAYKAVEDATDLVDSRRLRREKKRRMRPEVRKTA